MGTLRVPCQLALGYELWPDYGLAIVQYEVVAADVVTMGPLDEEATWLTWSDAICFVADVLPPDLIIVARRPVGVAALGAREVDHG